MFTEFFRSIKFLVVTGFIDEVFFKKLVNCTSVQFDFDAKNEPGDGSTKLNFEKILQILPISSKLCIIYQKFYLSKCSNKVLDLIPLYANTIEYLNLDNYCKINFNFFFELPRLKIVHLQLRYAFDQSIFIELLCQLKDLCVLEIFFVKPIEMEKDQLSSFKKLVLHFLKKEIKAKEFNFIIEIHKSNSDDQKVIRYYYLRTNFFLTVLKDKIDKSQPQKLVCIIQPFILI